MIIEYIKETFYYCFTDKTIIVKQQVKDYKLIIFTKLHSSL